MTTSRKLRVVVVGAGDMGLRHALAWRELRARTNGEIEGELVGLVDDAPARLEAARDLFRLSDSTLFSDYQEAIASARPDVVSVCVPTAFHTTVGLVAIEHGAHVLIEKPLALTLEQADSVISAAERQGVLLAVGFMLRYSPAVRQLQNWVTQGKLGQPLFYSAENFMGIRPKIVMHHKNINGGPLVDYWCHHFDLWSLLFQSEPLSVTGYGSTFAQGKPEVAHLSELAVDTAGVLVRYANGSTGQLSTSWGLPRGLSVTFSADRLVGPLGIVIGDIRKSLTLYSVEEGSQVQVQAENIERDFWQDEITALARAIVQGGAPLAGGAEGRKALELSLAALESIETGQVVKLAKTLQV
ncbi:MAG TPA: Gfo/Idh/MocA family oxidoreductase [Chloroflexia bacterium]|nr:Gfo/Idh/MocA family oxidoreductase [Chloroflexia bacterium]